MSDSAARTLLYRAIESSTVGIAPDPRDIDELEAPAGVNVQTFRADARRVAREALELYRSGDHGGARRHIREHVQNYDGLPTGDDSHRTDTRGLGPAELGAIIPRI